jgi:hypothetical protein
MNGVSWEKCCAEAIDYASAMGMTLTSRPQTVMEWYRLFRRNRKFIQPLQKKDNLPPFLQQNPDIVQALQQYGHENLGQLSIEFMTEYVHGVVLPSMVAKEKKLPVDEKQQEEGYQTEMCKVIKKYGLTKVCPATVYKWMKCLGYKYETRRKGYYVDGHEKPSTVEYRSKFVKWYLQNELHMHRWIQVTREEARKLEEDGKVAEKSGYTYLNADNEPMVEYHVDDSKEFGERLKNLPFKGTLSVGKGSDELPLICFGHDECIFKQFIMTNKSWIGPNGETVAVPKDDEQGLMISAFQSREFGFGMPLNEEQLKEVNKYREGKLYTDQDAAMATRQHKEKKPLTSTPFIQEFEYGKNNDGYWTYQWMVCQLDDCVDVLKTLFGNQYDFLFMFDHSCGHDKKRTDGLIVENMAKIYGGKQAVMRNTEIKGVLAYLGPFTSSKSFPK